MASMLEIKKWLSQLFNAYDIVIISVLVFLVILMVLLILKRIYAMLFFRHLKRKLFQKLIDSYEHKDHQ